MLLTNTEEFKVDLENAVYYVRYSKGMPNPEVVRVHVATVYDDCIVVTNKEKHRIVVLNKHIPYRMWHSARDAEKALEAMKKKDNWVKKSYTVECTED